MQKVEGYWDVTPKIKDVLFLGDSDIEVDLEDGRRIIMPVSAFPSLNAVPSGERADWYRMGSGAFTWDSCTEVIHVEQILGNYQRYAHEP